MALNAACVSGVVTQPHKLCQSCQLCQKGRLGQPHKLCVSWVLVQPCE